MDLKLKNISIRIKELDTEIHLLEQRLAAMNWERKKYLQFSDNYKKYFSNSSVK